MHKNKKNNLVILLTTIFHVPDFQVAVNIHWNEMVSKGKEQVNLNTVTIKGVNKLERGTKCEKSIIFIDFYSLFSNMQNSSR